MKHSIFPRNQSAKHPDSRCFGISGVVIGSALSKGWRSGPEAFCAVHFLRLGRNPEEERIVSHDASGFIFYYHFECDVIIVLQLARSESRSARYGVFPNK